MITIVGLGQNKDDVTIRGKKAIAKADILIARTLMSPASKPLKTKASESFDNLYESASDFSELDNKIVSRLLELEKANADKNIVYCVDGDGYLDSSVVLLAQKITLNIIAGVSDTGIRKPGFDNYIVSAYYLLGEKPLINTRVLLSVNGIDNTLLAGEVKLFLLDYYLPQTPVSFSSKNKQNQIMLEDLDRQKSYGTPCSIFIDGQTDFINPHNDGFRTKYSFADLIKILQKLTAPDGCEWDKVQTHKSIRINLIEEAYEAVDAIDNGDIDAMIEEFGDVLLQSVLHSDIAARAGEFTLNDVIDALCYKLVSRHTHIFGSDKATNAADALNFWEKAKAAEKNHRSLTDDLNSIPQVFPATLRAEKAFKKTVKAGLAVDCEKLKNLLNKAIDSGNTEKALFLLVALLAANKKDAEVELNKIANDFIQKCKDQKDINFKELDELL